MSPSVFPKDAWIFRFLFGRARLLLGDQSEKYQVLREFTVQTRDTFFNKFFIPKASLEFCYRNFGERGREREREGERERERERERQRDRETERET